MSAALLGLALKAKLHSQTRKMVLIKLVDCCHEDGTRIYPSLATIAEDAECSVPTARRVMQMFCKVGLLRKVRDGGSGAKSTNHYEMDIEMLARLRRPEMWPALEAAALHQPMGDSDDDEEADAGPSTAPTAPAEGGNMGITVEGYHGDSLPNGAEGYHPDDTQPLSYNPYSEREGAQGREGMPASEGEPERRPAPAFEEFLDAYPFAKGDNRVQLRTAWEGVPFGERRAAIDGIGAFAEERKAGGLKSRLSSPAYLAGRCWVGLEAKAAKRQVTQAAGAFSEVKGWSREWWQVLLLRIAEGNRQRVGFAVQQAEAHKSLSVPAGDLAAADKRFGEMKTFLCRGPEIDAWRPWLAERGARIPVFDERSQFRVFLPSEKPPAGRKDEGDDDVRF